MKRAEPSTTADSQADADAAWRALHTSADVSGRATGQTTLQKFLQTAELSAQQYRRKGLEFWEEFPDDPRRYSWLQITVHIPPYYPVNLEEWSAQQADPRLTTRSPVDESARSKWNEIYPSLREAFWSAPETTEMDRRFLWAGELLNEVNEAHFAFVRGEEAVTSQLLDSFVEFATTYADSLGVDDDSAHSSMLKKIWWSLIHDQSGAFSWSPETAIAFIKRVERTDNEILAKDRRMPGRADDIAPSIATATRLRIEENNAVSDVMSGALVSTFESSPSYDRLWRQLTGLGIDGGSSGWSLWPFSFASYFVHYYEFERASQLFRGHGMMIWDNDPAPDPQIQALWLIQTLHRTKAKYPLDLFGGIYHSALAIDDTSVLDVDIDARGNWQSLLPVMVEQIWDEPTMTDEIKKLLFNNVVKADFFTNVPYAWRTERDDAAVSQLLESIEQIYTEFGDANESAYWAKRLLRERPLQSYGLTDSDLRRFFEQLAVHDNPQMKEPLAVFENYIALRTTPFELVAETLEGNQFDLAATRGRLTLIDMWKTSCAACIAAMPRIKGVYQDYAEKGFDVVSVVFDGDLYPNRVKRIKAELQLPWITVVADDLYDEYSKRYGFKAFPQYFLLGRDGTVYAGTGELDNGRNLANLLDEMLDAEKVELH